MQRRTENFAEQRRKHPPLQNRMAGLSTIVTSLRKPRLCSASLVREHAVDQVLRWRPRSIALRVASILSCKLIIAGEATLVERCITEAHISTPWDLFLLTPLALAGKEVNVSRLESSVASLLRHRLIRLHKLQDTWSDDNATAEYLDMILTACEVIVARGGNRACIVPVLECFADREFRRRDRLFTSQVSRIDFSLRAHALLERLAGRKIAMETYWVEPPEPPGDLPPKQVEQLKRSDDEKKKELQNFIGPLIEIYDIRAQALIGSISPADVDTQLRNAIASLPQSGVPAFEGFQCTGDENACRSFDHSAYGSAGTQPNRSLGMRQFVPERTLGSLRLRGGTDLREPCTGPLVAPTDPQRDHRSREGREAHEDIRGGQAHCAYPLCTPPAPHQLRRRREPVQ